MTIKEHEKRTASQVTVWETKIDFKRIIDITYRFSGGWRKVYNPITGRDVADNLTTMEFAAAMLAARGWTNQEM